MKHLLILTFSLLTMISCKDNNANNKTSESGIGGDKDSHGCLTAAGQTWSELKQDCVQVFKVGKRLDPINQEESETILSAFVIFNDDESKCELFLPQNKISSIILIQSEDGIYTNQQYKFNTATSTLSKDGEPTYKGS
ncbi:hypothetical protein OS188_11770 [Xanthomarina sp. F1114]|uniref:hypothetical protein n=1 Tax=Xanthomarina sp. F1114 TaxID=2996019 RepID=UPI00225E11FA|nr:hypothetical protein [Xanthomarina sp. F1114]MCX7548629.1 hypothetical protein [Xanthomarina sp. F1114]